MKRTQLIEWGIIAVGLIFGYKFFEGLFSILFQVVYNFGENGLDKFLIKLFFLCGVYAASFILLIRKSALIAAWVNGPSENDTIGIKINKRSLLQVILIGICAVTVLSNIAEILLYLFETFKREAGRIHEPFDTTLSKYRFTVAVVETIVALVILYFSKDISGWFIQKNEVDELTFDSNPEN